jgi:serine phosphatase RsbU (regulator of sigma subunit)
MYKEESTKIMGKEQKQIKVLIIEDDAFIALLLKEYLNKWGGYEVVDVIADGQIAIDQFTSLNPDLMLVDIHLEGDLSGIDVVSKIKEKHSLPVLYITADLSDEIVTSSLDTEPSGYLIKPFEENQLKATVESSISTFSKINESLDKLKTDLNLAMQQVEELSETNAHLITATFRERALKQELAASKELIEAQTKKIQDSINYSLRIQQSIIPSNETFNEALNNHFVFYRPKDVVSGDFPWMYTKGDYVYVAAVDCTGHGVPGAMMSMIGNLLLNSIVGNGAPKTPSEVLAELHKAVVYTLKQDAEGNKAADGMDAALCRINYKENELLFSGAHLPMFFMRNGELETLKGDKFPVGGMQYRNRNTYSDHTIKLEKGDKFYIFSDGIIDQVGGEEGRKWMSVSLKEFIEANNHLSMSEIRTKIEETFLTYKGDHKQVDDVLLIGVEV